MNGLQGRLKFEELLNFDLWVRQIGTASAFGFFNWLLRFYFL